MEIQSLVKDAFKLAASWKPVKRIPFAPAILNLLSENLPSAMGLLESSVSLFKSLRSLKKGVDFTAAAKASGQTHRGDKRPSVSQSLLQLAPPREPLGLLPSADIRAASAA